jgi:hypothetical protein
LFHGLKFTTSLPEKKRAEAGPVAGVPLRSLRARHE